MHGRAEAKCDDGTDKALPGSPAAREVFGHRNRPAQYLATRMQMAAFRWDVASRLRGEALHRQRLDPDRGSVWMLHGSTPELNPHQLCSLALIPSYDYPVTSPGLLRLAPLKPASARQDTAKLDPNGTSCAHYSE